MIGFVQRRLTELRCQKTLEKERIRKDYDKMNAQLDELSKTDNFAKIHNFVSTPDSHNTTQKGFRNFFP